LNLEIEKKDLYLKNIPFLIFSPTPDLAQPSSPFPFPASACFPAAQPRFPFLLPGLLRGPVSPARSFLLPGLAAGQPSRTSPPFSFSSAPAFLHLLHAAHPALARSARPALRLPPHRTACARGPLRPSPARRSAAPVPHSLTPGPLGQTPARALPLSLTALLASPISTLSFLPRRIPFLPRAPPSFSRPVNGAAMQGMRPPSPTHGRRPTRPLPSFFLRLCPPIKTRPSPPLCPFLGSPFQSPPPPLSHCSGVDSTSSTSPRARTLSYAPVGTFNLPFWP